MQVVRVLILALAIVMCAWFVLGIRQAHEVGEATSIVSQPATLSATRKSEAASALRSAGTLNPDQEVNILRARLALAERNFARAVVILERVVRGEPNNLEAWIWLGGASVRDAREGQVALAHIDKLDPRSAPRR